MTTQPRWSKTEETNWEQDRSPQRNPSATGRLRLGVALLLAVWVSGCASIRTADVPFKVQPVSEEQARGYKLCRG